MYILQSDIKIKLDLINITNKILNIFKIQTVLLLS